MEHWKRHQFSVLDISRELHSHVVGSSEIHDAESIQRRAIWLQWRISTWEPSESPFDHAVRTLMLAALEEYLDWLRQNNSAKDTGAVGGCERWTAEVLLATDMCDVQGVLLPRGNFWVCVCGARGAAILDQDGTPRVPPHARPTPVAP